MNQGFFSIFFDETGTISGSKDKNPYGGGYFVVEDKYLDDCRSFMEELKSNEGGNIHLSKIQSEKKKLRICKEVSQFLYNKNCFLKGYIESNSNLESQISLGQNVDVRHYKKFRMHAMYSSLFDVLFSEVILNKKWNQINIKLIIESLGKELDPNEEENIIQSFELGTKEVIQNEFGITIDLCPRKLIYKKKEEEILLSIADLAAYSTNAVFRGNFSYYRELDLIFRKSGLSFTRLYHSIIKETKSDPRVIKFYEDLKKIFKQSGMDFEDIHGIMIVHTLLKSLEKYVKMSLEEVKKDLSESLTT